MTLLTSLKSALGFSAATLPPVPLPKPPNAPRSEPAYRTVVGGTASALSKQDRGLLTSDRLTVRNSRDTFSAIRSLSYASPDLSAAIYATLRTGIPERFTLIARDMDGKIDTAGTGLAQELLRRLTYLGAVDGSYGAQQTIQTLSETLGKELLLYGAAAVEVALDKARVPASMNVVSVTKLKWYDEDKATRAVQVVGGEEIDLDIPNFIYVSLDPDTLDPYSNSPFEAAMQPILADIEINNDIRRALKRSILPRLIAAIDSEAVKKGTPPEILQDANKYAEYKQSLISAVQGVINGAAPEDCFVSFDEISYSYVDGGAAPGEIIAKVQEWANSKLQSGAKTLPTVLGRGSNANSSSTEALLFVKSANIVRVKLNEIYSRALTIALRLSGVDGYVEFTYAPIDLRPESELTAFKVMEQSRVLELLSLGLISDEEACIQLTGNLPPAGYKPLSGTMFKTGTLSPSAQPGTATSNTSAMDKSLTPTTPKQPKTA